jgi:hypothetical protein
VQQFTSQRRIVGAFQVSVTVSADHEKLAIDDKDQLAILKYNLALMAAVDRWRPIQERIIAQLSERLEGFNIDPGSVTPSPWGAGPHRPVLGGGTGRDEDDRVVRFVGEVELPLNAELEIDIQAKIRIRSKDIE